MSALRLVTLIMLSSAHVAHAQGNFWSPSSGPYGSTISKVAVAPDGSVYAVGSGLHRSADSGQSWTQVGSWSWTRSVAFAGPDTVFAATSTGVFRSTDEGGTWTQVFPAAAYTVVVADDGRIFVGTDTGGVFMSINDAASWAELNAEATQAGYRNWVRAIVPISSAELLYATHVQSVIRLSIETGGWVLIPDFPLGATDLAEVGAGFVAAASPSLPITSDGGQSWSDLGAPGSLFWDVAADGAGVIALSADANGVALSLDGGQSWESRADGLVNPTTRSVAIDEEGYLYAGTECCVQRSSEPVSTTLRKGDLTFTGLVGTSAASIILAFLVGEIPFMLWHFLVADVSGDGNVTAFDAGLILQCIVEVGEGLPVEDPAACRF